MNKYTTRIAAILGELGVPADFMTTTAMPLQQEASELADAGSDMFERPLRMTPATLEHWRSMHQAAAEDGIDLMLVSAFRSVDYQRNLIRAKLDKGQQIEAILRVNAPPGYSEHHTGRALDIATPGQEPLVEAFESTEAFHWLSRNASHFDFSLSYPRDNPFGITYEPWHWAYHPD